MRSLLAPVLCSAIEALDVLELRYAVVGGLAMGSWGVIRATKDVDLYADLPEAVRPKVRRELEARGFRVPAMEEELQQFGVFRSRFQSSGVFLDIFSAVGPLGEAILERRRPTAIEGRTVWTISAEDLAVLKAFSDRERDFDDLVRLTSVLGSQLDVSYVEHWARLLDESIGGDEVGDRVRRALEARRKPAPRR